jgi:uncharacterized protein
LFESYPNEKRKAPRLKVLLTISLLIISGAGLLYYGARRFERAVVFHPVRYGEGDAWKRPFGAEDVWFATADGGERLHGWYTPARALDDARRAPTVIYFHGNGGNINTVGWLAEALSERGFNSLLFDYRGYGKSEGRATDERAIYADATAAYDYLVNERDVRPEQIVLYGQSLGTTAAVDLAGRKPCGALILESGLSSAEDMAVLILPSVPRWVYRYGQNHFESARKLSEVRVPVLVAHGARDRTIPVEQGRKLYEAAREPKRLIILPEASHNDMIATGGREYLNALADFIRSSVRAGE